MGKLFFFVICCCNFTSKIVEKQAQRAAGRKYCVKIR